MKLSCLTPQFLLKSANDRLSFLKMAHLQAFRAENGEQVARRV